MRRTNGAWQGELFLEPARAVGAIFDGERMFALLSRAGALYLRVDEENRDAHLQADLPQFFKMPYFGAPAGALDDAEM